MKKFELTAEFKTNIFGKKLFRIKALVSFGNVEAGELGGYVEREENLSQEGNAWVCGNAEVCGNARVYGDAEVCGNARVYGDAKVCGNAEVCGNAWVYEDAKVCGNAEVCGDAKVCGNAEVSNDSDYAIVKGFGSQHRFTTFFRTKEKEIGVKCGCFLGTLAEFRLKVQATHGETKIAKEYLMLADLMEYKFQEEK